MVRYGTVLNGPDLSHFQVVGNQDVPDTRFDAIWAVPTSKGLECFLSGHR